MENFFAVPRYRGATLHQEVRYKYSGVLVRGPHAQTLTPNPYQGAHPKCRLPVLLPAGLPVLQIRLACCWQPVL